MGSFLNDEEVRLVEPSNVTIMPEIKIHDYPHNIINLVPEVKYFVPPSYNSMIEEYNQKYMDPSLWEVLRFLMKIPYLMYLICLIYILYNKWEGLKMTNDKKATILGYVKSALVVLITLFLAKWVKNPDSLADILVVAIGAIWAVIEVIMGYFTNKPEDKPIV